MEASHTGFGRLSHNWSRGSEIDRERERSKSDTNVCTGACTIQIPLIFCWVIKLLISGKERERSKSDTCTGACTIQIIILLG